MKLSTALLIFAVTFLTLLRIFGDPREVDGCDPSTPDSLQKCIDNIMKSPQTVATMTKFMARIGWTEATRFDGDEIADRRKFGDHYVSFVSPAYGAANVIISYDLFGYVTKAIVPRARINERWPGELWLVDGLLHTEPPLMAEAAPHYVRIVAARRHAGTPIEGFDALIAATAASGASIATRDVGGFAGCDLTVIDPWAEAATR